MALEALDILTSLLNDVACAGDNGSNKPDSPTPGNSELPHADPNSGPSRAMDITDEPLSASDVEELYQAPIPKIRRMKIGKVKGQSTM